MTSLHLLVLILLIVTAVQPLGAQTLYSVQSLNAEDGGVFGTAVSGAGDVNDDGFMDFVVGAPKEDAPQALHAGRAYIFDGEDGSVFLPLLLTPNPEYNGAFGSAVAGAGDVNNDTYDDVVIGAPWENGGDLDAGRVYVFAGNTFQLLHTLQSPTPIYLGFFGASVAGAGDVNNDGFDDIIVGAHREDAGGSIAGTAYVFHGSTGAILHSLVSPTMENGGGFGSSVAGAGDVNGDGYDDVIVGARGQDGGAFDAGRAYVFNGLTGVAIHTLESPNPEDFGWFGCSVAGVGDVNLDGRGDVVVGACFEDAGAIVDAGKAYLFDGSTGALIAELVSPNPDSAGYFGYSVAGAGYADGIPGSDIVIGAYNEGTGHAYVFSGTGGLAYTLLSPGAESGGGFGISVSTVGALAGDPYSDLVIGAYLEDGGATDAGKAYVQTPVVAGGEEAGGSITVQWTSCPDASAFWVYGAANQPLFEPGAAPGFEHRLDQLPSTTQSWSSASGVGNPLDNWTYLILAVDGAEDEITRSNRIGEFDFQGDIP